MKHPKHKAPAQHKAADYLRECVRSGVFSEGQFLPSITRLASHAGVSRHSMWKALLCLKAEGLVSGDPGHKIRVAYAENTSTGDSLNSDSAVEPEALDTHAQFPWQRIRRELKKEILNGRLRPGAALPSVKELRNRFSTSFSTLKKALEALVSEELLVPQRRGYSVPAVQTRRSTARITLIGLGDEKDNLVLGEHDELFWRLLELECSKAGVLIDILLIPRKPEEPDHLFTIPYYLRQLENKEEVLGYIYLINSPECIRKEIFDQLLRYKKPVAVVDEEGGWPYEKYIPVRSRFRIFKTTISSEPGRHAARYLLSRGHTSIAYLSSHHSHFWARQRLRGVLSTYDAAGYGDDVKRFCFDLDSLRTPAGVDRHETFDLNPMINTVERAFNRQKVSAPTEFTKLMRQYINRLKGEVQTLSERAHHLEALFDTILADNTITAWLCATDFEACTALDYLSKTPVTIPDRLSIVSFDDTIGALWYHLTSYNFNIPGLVHTILNFILRTGPGGHIARKRVITIEGVLIERKTSGPSPR